MPQTSLPAQSISSSNSKSKKLNPDHPLLSSLNAEQQRAVLASRGPILILAGAGTGKTRVIAHRIAAHLQSNPELTPANILALTFSRKAAQEMLDRVETLTHTYADALGVFTFHGFCNQFLQDHALQLGLSSRFRLLDPTDAWIFFRKLLPELKLTYHWNLMDPTDCIDGFLRFISRAKDELVSPEDLKQYADRLEDPEASRRMQEVARVYKVYQKKMRESGYLDFGDLIVETCRHLEAQPALLKQIREQYRYILVDEFQDTNVSQVALLRLLAGDGQHLCVVGDDDQAIYRFRGASFASFLLMQASFPKVQSIQLTQNYRSTQRILAAADRLIQHNGSDRYDPEKRLMTQNPVGLAVRVIIAEDEVQEAQGVAQTIATLMKERPDGFERLDQIAVLYRAHAHRERLVEALRAKQIPFLVRGGQDLFAEPVIKDLSALLRLLDDPDDSINGFRLLSQEGWGLSQSDLLLLSRTAREKEISLMAVLRRAGKLPLSASGQAAASEFLKVFLSLKRQLVTSDIIRLVEQVAESRFLKPALVLEADADSRSGLDPMVVLGRFLRLTHRYAQNYPKAQELGDFLWYLDSLGKARAGTGFEESEPPAAGRVQLMTVHQAKGLEFDWVVLLGMVQGRFPGRARPEPIPFPVELMKESLPQGDYHLQEERRLCYVACTRARKGLFIFTQDRAYHRSSIFVRELLKGASSEDALQSSLDLPSESVSGEVSFQSAGLATRLIQRKLFALMEKIALLPKGNKSGLVTALDQVKRLAASMQGRGLTVTPPQKEKIQLLQEKISFTQLETFRYCPRKYLYSYIYRIPTRSSPAMSLGSDLHTALEVFYRQVMKGQIPPQKELVETFRKLHHPGQYGEPFQDHEIFQLGLDLLRRFYKAQKNQFAPPLFVERPFALRLGGFSIKGVVDRVDALGEDGVEIIDYKSGRPKRSASKEEQLQLRLYALAAQDVFGLKPARVSFYYLRNNEKLSFDQTPESLEETRERITDLTQGLKTSDFSPEPALAKCRRCDFRGLCPASKA